MGLRKEKGRDGYGKNKGKKEEKEEKGGWEQDGHWEAGANKKGER